MTPAARIAAAAEVLDAIAGGLAAEQALSRWGRANRFAGSGDRAAIRDHVFDALRRHRSFAARGGGETGRALMLGMLRQAGRDPGEVFTGEGHAPAALTPEEEAAGRMPEGAEALDCPDWLAPDLKGSLGPDFEPVLKAMQGRADVFLRVNVLKASRDAMLEELAAEGIVAEPHPPAPNALRVTEGARRIRNARAFTEGRVELQDAGSQAICEAIPLPQGGRVLDFCAGGGGKSLALAARAPGLGFTAHDAHPQRMNDLPTRAARAGVKIATADAPEGPFDLVVADVPCSGSGAWRRQPEAKWRLDRTGLEALCALQADILDQVAPMVAPRGRLAYITCSLLEAENGAQAESFLARHPGWQKETTLRLTPLDSGDGFFLAIFRRSPGE
ncbi:RsmB/NOP family class I SAM-dependent RNA methyltransferase [Vannielia litorea]|uniref:RsmB/NOP family class I SAM-dependent RNA methyltransferase n=1 Tax=Vannielia litorea TaxID=1217970 RepID=UPI001C94031B|nr:RsmB/NOP family class I SAM-dependent RNA methyltransferase [Vannielia litorea]MBY6153013.1 RsmB/NOP family class I SAM-dependent RNA methyltransferase [Vannielia litorea]